MKRFWGLLIILALWVGSWEQATNSAIVAGVQQSLQAGSAQQLATYFDTTIELIIDSEAVDFQSVQATHAELILRSFFRRYPPRRFQYVYQGDADRQHYSTGTYQTRQERFQVYVLMREIDGPTGKPHHYLINTLHFRKAN